MQISKKDRNRLKKAVKNFNAKVKRVAAKNPDIAPNKLSYATIARQVRNKHELEVEIAEIKAWSKKGAEYKTMEVNVGWNVPPTEEIKKGAKATPIKMVVSEWAYNRMIRKLNMVNEQRVLQNRELYQRYGTTTTHGGITKTYVNARIDERTLKRDVLKPFAREPKNIAQFNAQLSQLENKLYKESWENEGKTYKENMLKAFRKHYLHDSPMAYKGDYAKLYNEAIQLLKAMSPTTMLEYYYAEEDLLDIQYHYRDPVDDMTKLKALIRKIKYNEEIEYNDIQEG